MARATSIYILMLAVFGAGLWFILSVGSIFLRARPDLSGPWQLWAIDDDSAPAAEAFLEQSGRFCRLHIEGGRPISLRILQDGPNDRGAARVVLKGDDDLEVCFDGQLTGSSYRLTLRGPMTREWIARRPGRGREKPSDHHPHHSCILT